MQGELFGNIFGSSGDVAASPQAPPSSPLPAETGNWGGDPVLVIMAINQPVIIDADMFYWLFPISWRVTGRYVRGYIPAEHPLWGATYGRREMSMHRLLTDPESKLFCDHINRNRFDNRRSNLRMLTPRQSRANTGPKASRRHSTFKGVSFNPLGKRHWFMGIKMNGGFSYTKTLHTERQAAIAYDIYAKREWGEYAFLNIPTATESEVAEVEAILLNPKSYPGSSQYVGVCKTKYGTWTAAVGSGKQRVHLGSFATELEAATAYNRHVEAAGMTSVAVNALPLAMQEVEALKAKLPGIDP